jgi:hypothetical protein
MHRFGELVCRKTSWLFGCGKHDIDMDAVALRRRSDEIWGGGGGETAASVTSRNFISVSWNIATVLKPFSIFKTLFILI